MLGVSNTAGTLNFNINMKTIAYIILILIAIICAHIFIKSTVRIAVTSSPVEEMYHRQLVTTIDSILDARFGDCCCEEYTDTVSANTFNTRFCGMISPMK